MFFGDASNVEGNVDSGSGITIDFASNVEGDVTANDDLFLGNGSAITGDVNVGGNASFGIGTSIDNNLTLGGTIQAGAPGVGGTITESGSPASPKMHEVVTVPVASTFSAGGPVPPSVGNTTTVSPGSYGVLTLPAGQILELASPGDYHFDAIAFGANNSIRLDLDAGSFRIFIVNTVEISGGGLRFFGLSSGAQLNPGSASSAANAANLFWEVGQNFDMGGGSNDWFGTVFAPEGSIMVRDRFNDLAGALYAGGGSGQVMFFDDSNDFTFHLANNLPSQFDVELAAPTDLRAIPGNEMVLLQ